MSSKFTGVGGGRVSRQHSSSIIPLYPLLSLPITLVWLLTIAVSSSTCYLPSQLLLSNFSWSSKHLQVYLFNLICFTTFLHPFSVSLSFFTSELFLLCVSSPPHTAAIHSHWKPTYDQLFFTPFIYLDITQLIPCCLGPNLSWSFSVKLWPSILMPFSSVYCMAQYQSAMNSALWV